jgi:hypothetical protein
MPQASRLFKSTGSFDTKRVSNVTCPPNACAEPRGSATRYDDDKAASSAPAG